jgi:hypothetical protein
MDPITIIAIGGLLISAIPALKSLVDSGVDPTSEEFRQRAQALGVKGPEFDTALRTAKQQVEKSFQESSAVSAEQSDLARALKAQAEGKTPSLAQQQYARALEASQAAAASQLASARGMSPAAAQRLLLTQQAAARTAAAGQSAQLRLQEQAQAQGMLGNLLGQQRQQGLLGGQLAAGLYGTAAQQGMDQARLDQAARMGALGVEQQEQDRQQRMGGSFLQAGVAATSPFFSEMAKRSQPAQPTTQPAQSAVKSKGGEIKGRSKFNGNTRSNDTVPALLSPGEIVLPRSVAQSEDAPEKSKKFVEAIRAKKKPTPRDYIQALSRLDEMESRLNAMETLMDLEAEDD